MKALITGITGQTGSYLAELLLEKGYEVHGMIRRSSSFNTGRIDHLHSKWNIKLTLHYGDLSDGSNVSRLIEKIMPDEIYNLGAQSHVKVSFDVPEYTAQSDGVGVLRILDAIKEVNIKAKMFQACHDAKTFAITPDGPKCYNEIKKGDMVFSFNTKTHKIELKPVKNIFISKYHGKMVKLIGRRIDQLVTPNHTVILKQDNGKVLKIRAEKLKDKLQSMSGQHEYTSTLSLPWTNINKVLPSKYINMKELFNFPELERSNNFHKNLIFKFELSDFLYLLGIHIGDGYFASKKKTTDKMLFADRVHIRDSKGRMIKLDSNIKNTKRKTNKSTTILFAVPESDPARKDILAILEKYSIDYSVNKVNITFTCLPLSKAFHACGKNVYYKHIPSFVWKFEAYYLEALLKGLIASDGGEKKNKYKQYATVSKKLAYQVSALALTCNKYSCVGTGRIGTAYISEGGTTRIITGTTTPYQTYITTTSKNKLYMRMIKNKTYSGLVWCLEVADNHNFLICRNGKISFSGNSTSELYGKVQQIPQNENTPFYPRSPYAAAKAFGFHVTRNYREAYGIFACNGICFNHTSERRGETFVSRKITRAIGRIQAGLQDKVYLGNLSALRDWSYAPDICVGIWKMLQQKEPDDYVLASGENHSVEEFCTLAFAEAGMPLSFIGEGINRKGIDAVGHVRVEVDPKYFRPTEVDTLLGDPRKAQEKLGWKATTPFLEIVQKMVDHDLALAAAEARSK